ncbi:YveK family protein [Haloimpatiens sp. FM7315]|uniref:YveK family protein n=1 Tax=Haloimpatiens sp. FM7315 TaxID=3298609 RepID=UPI0035A36625
MEEEMTLDIRELLWMIKKRIKMIVLITFIISLSTFLVSAFVIAPTYEAKVSVVIGKSQNSGDNEKGNYNYNDVMMYQNLVKTYGTIAQSDDVARRTIKRLNLDMESKNLKAALKVNPKQGTQILDIKIESKDPNEAKAIVDTLTQEFIDKASKLIPNGNVQMLDKAQIPENPVKPRKLLNTLIAFFIGLMLSLGLTFLLEYMDNTVKTEEDIKKILDLPVIGVIPDHEV